MKKNYLSPETMNIKLMTEPLMQIVSGETIEGPGVGEGSAGDDDPEVAGKNRGWGNVWK